MSRISSPPTCDQLQLDDLCERFEADLRQGSARPIPAYLPPEDAPLAMAAVRTLLWAEWDYLAEQSLDIQLEGYSELNLLAFDQLRLCFQQWQAARSGHLVFAGFELLERLGQGRFGAVWRAIDPQLNRTVAVKISHPAMVEDEYALVRESKAAARLQHPSIARIISAGAWQGRAYIVREYVQGQALSEVLKRRRLACDDAARLAWKLATALDYSHRHDCIHRDLKPGNIILQTNGEPCIIDFGLAKTSASSGDHPTADNTVMGTPVYMSPEQARGESRQADRRSDVYSLGVVLFEMLTGRLPFLGDFTSTLHDVLNKQPPHPRTLNPATPRPLAIICLKCLAKEPSSRYQSADALADDLDRFLGGRPIQAAAESTAARWWRLAKANPLIAALTTMIVVLSITVAIVAVRSARHSRVMLREESRLRAAAEVSKRHAEQARQRADAATNAARAEALLASEVTEYLESILSSSDPWTGRLDNGTQFGDPSLTAAEMLDRAGQQIDRQLHDQPRLKPRVLDILATINANLGRLDKAQRLLDESTALRREWGEPDNRQAEAPEDIQRDIARHWLCRGQLAHLRGDFDEAIRQLDESHRRFSQLDSTEALQLAEVWFVKGWVYNDARQSAQARQCFERCLEIRQQHLAPEDRRILAARLGLATCRSVDQHQTGLEVVQSIAGDDPRAARLLGLALQAHWHQQQADFAAAAATQRQLLEGLEQLGMANTPWGLLARGDHANTLFELGDYRGAWASIEPVLEAARRLAPRHHRVLHAYRKLAYEMYLAGRHEQAEEFFALAVQKKFDSVSQRCELSFWRAENLLSLGELSQAARVVASAEVQPGQLDLNLRIWHAWLLGRLASGANGKVERLEHCQQALQLSGTCDRSRGPGTDLNRMANIYEWAGDNQEAERLLRLAIRQEIHRRHERHPRVANRQVRLAKFLLRHDRRHDALPLLHSAQAIWQSSLPTDDPRIAATQQLLE